MSEASAVSRLHRHSKGICRGTPFIMARPHSIPDQPKPKAAARQRRHAGPPGGAESRCHDGIRQDTGLQPWEASAGVSGHGPRQAIIDPASRRIRQEGGTAAACRRAARKGGNPASRTVQRNASWRGDQPGLCADKGCRGRGRGQSEKQAAGAAVGRPKDRFERFDSNVSMLTIGSRLLAFPSNRASLLFHYL